MRGVIAAATRAQSMFSFHPAKNLTTGEGGALVTASDEIAARAQRLRFHGIDQTAESRFGGRGAGTYDVVEAGFKYNFTDLQAAIGLHQLARLGEMNARRAAIAQQYLEQLAHVPHVLPLDRAPYPHVNAWHLMVVRLEVEALTATRDEILAELKEKGVAPGLHFVPLHLQTLYRPLVDDPSQLAVATDAFERILSLPLYPDMSDADVTTVVDALADVVGRRTRTGSTSQRRAGGGVS